MKNTEIIEAEFAIPCLSKQGTDRIINLTMAPIDAPDGNQTKQHGDFLDYILNTKESNILPPF